MAKLCFTISEENWIESLSFKVGSPGKRFMCSKCGLVINWQSVSHWIHKVQWFPLSMLLFRIQTSCYTKSKQTALSKLLIFGDPQVCTANWLDNTPLKTYANKKKWHAAFYRPKIWNMNTLWTLIKCTNWPVYQAINSRIERLISD